MISCDSEVYASLSHDLGSVSKLLNSFSKDKFNSVPDNGMDGCLCRAYVCTGPGGPNQSALYPGVKRAGSEADVSSAFQAYVKNTWTSTTWCETKQWEYLRTR